MFLKRTNLRPNHGLKHSIQLICSEAVRLKTIKEVLYVQNTQPTQVLQRADATGLQLRQHKERRNVASEPTNTAKEYVRK